MPGLTRRRASMRAAIAFSAASLVSAAFPVASVVPAVLAAAGAIGWPRVSAAEVGAPAGAPTGALPGAPSGETGNDVLVTASRTVESLDEVLWSADVLTRSDIEASQALALQSLLAELPGVQYDNTGGLGKQTSLFVRGTNADQTLLLIDGVRVGSATTGIPPIELIPVGEIERIEVVRGPRSTLYGSDAMGGVIQIFTRGSAQPGWSAEASATGGTYSTFDETLDLRGTLGRAWLGARGEVQHTAGFEACSGLPAQGQPPTDCFGGPVDHDGYLNRSGSFTAGVRFGDGWTAAIDSLLTSGHTDYDGTYSDSTAFAERVTSLHVDGRITDRWNVHVVGGRDVDDADDFLAGAPVDRYETRRDTASLQFDGAIVQALRIVAGADWYGDRIEAVQIFDQAVSPIPFTRTTRDTTGTFVELHGATGPVTELAGVRREHNTQFGDHVTEDLGAGWQLARHYRLTATWGTAFHAPTFNDLYFPAFPGFPPPSNPDLKPEVSRSLELGFEGRWDTLRWSVHVFQTDIHGLITYPPPDYTPVNLDEARIRGVELEGAWRYGAWTLSGNITGLDPRDRSPATAGNPSTRGNLLPRRAESSALLDARRTLWGRVSLAARGRWEGRRFDDLANTVPLGGYFLLDFLADASIGEGWSIEGRITNALGRVYYTAANENPPSPVTYYNQPRRELDLTVRYRFDSSGAR